MKGAQYHDTFYPRPPRGGRLAYATPTPVYKTDFLSTSPAWGTTGQDAAALRAGFLSIHVPRVGDDRQDPLEVSVQKSFYPRPPRGGRPWTCSFDSRQQIFLSTSPAWGTTRQFKQFIRTCSVFLSTSPAWGTTGCSNRANRYIFLSIHVPRVGDDRFGFRKPLNLKTFYPRPPRGGRP